MIILASKSQRRIDIFNRLGFKFKVIPADISEEFQCYGNQAFLPCRLAELKAEKVGCENPDTITVGADTLVFYNNGILGKPNNLIEAQNFLLELSGQWHSVISGVCFLRYEVPIKTVFMEESRIKFKILDSEIIKEYFSKVNPLDKAGGYAVQEHGDIIIEEIYGSIDNVVGFPTEKFLKFFEFSR
ncbi:MAG: Maf family protein [Victivallales bacterium]|nr:Maf family protein [Victivallales bacterium]